jgi:predicted O-linked N-acetylglucosamine transferase (SPINDLY family)
MSRLQAGYADEALGLFRKAAALEPGRLTHFGGAAAASNYAAQATPGSIAEAHRDYGRALSRILEPRPPAHLFGTSCSDDAGPLRVGFLSPDFRRHAVPMFLLPILENLDLGRVQPVLYSCSPTVDDVTERLRRSAALVDVSALQPEALAARIAADRIHILVDLAGHTVNTRLPVFALRPAPLQVTYLGYPATTGVDAIYFRIVDDQTDAPEAAWLDVERPARLNPCLLAFAPPEEAPPVAPPPSAAGKPFTFAAMSNLSKFNEPMIRTWTAVLDAAPGSRLLIRHTTLGEVASRVDLAARFHAAGADPARVIIEPPRADTAGVLASYAEVDVCLDTFPYSGTTTVCEALFMGVPVIIKPGLPSASRQSLTLLRAVGLDELIAADERAFVRIAAGLAADPARLAALRASLRARFLASPVGDGPGLARRFVDLLGALWAARSSAAGGPAATIMPP